MKKANSQLIVIFGASGDLTYRKLIPSLYSLEVQGLLPERYAILGVSLLSYSEDEFRDIMRGSLQKQLQEENRSLVEPFLKNIFYQYVEATEPTSYQYLKTKISEIQKDLSLPGNIIYYLATPPDLYGVIPRHLAAQGLNNEQDGWKRLIIEKPFGYNLVSAQELNASLQKEWEESQIYRIDHYLGKETVQNVLVTRFANGIFEPLWNRNYIDRVEITSAENIGVEQRGGYYEKSGALRDMIQNHLLHVVGFMAMEPPASLLPDAIRNETVKVFESIRPIKPEDVPHTAIRGQYLKATIRGEKVKGYRDEKGVAPQSKTETYAALKFYIDNWRWGGVPFYIRTGKHLPTRVNEAVIHFKPTPHYLFSHLGGHDSSNQLVLRIQPDEGLLFKLGVKTPGTGFNVQSVNMDFHYSSLAHQRIPEAYERLLLDCMNGDSTLYSRIDAVMATWKMLDPIINAWENDPSIPVYGYPAGTWGPEKADRLIEGGEKSWRYPCKNLSDDGFYCEL